MVIRQINPPRDLLCRRAVSSSLAGRNGMAGDNWIDAGAAAELARKPLQRLRLGAVDIALSHREGVFGAVSNACNHVGGPLGEGHLDGEYLVCPWHQWKFHRATGKGEPGFEADCVPSFPVKTEGARVLVNIGEPTKRTKSPHEPHPLARPVTREPGPVRVACISTTVMDRNAPRYSTSDDLLEAALAGAATDGCETRMIRLNSLDFEACQGFYSKHARLHLALLDHPNEPEGPVRSGL
jgi:nitrite reductase/ring-hydroxylating ferredoxin subunit